MEQANRASGAKVFDPALDVAPREVMMSMITEDGIPRPPFSEGAAGHVS